MESGGVGRWYGSAWMGGDVWDGMGRGRTDKLIFVLVQLEVEKSYVQHDAIGDSIGIEYSASWWRDTSIGKTVYLWHLGFQHEKKNGGTPHDPHTYPLCFCRTREHHRAYRTNHITSMTRAQVNIALFYDSRVCLLQLTTRTCSSRRPGPTSSRRPIAGQNILWLSKRHTSRPPTPVTHSRRSRSRTSMG